MKTRKHAEKLADRRAVYGDRRENRDLNRLIAEIMAANPGMIEGEARGLASHQRRMEAIARCR